MACSSSRKNNSTVAASFYGLPWVYVCMWYRTLYKLDVHMCQDAPYFAEPTYLTDFHIS